jgi:hypothetical protein
MSSLVGLKGSGLTLALEHEVVGLGGDGMHQTYDLGGHSGAGH